MKLAEKLALLMHRADMNQQQLAKEVGVSHPAVSGWMRGACPRKLVLHKIAAVFDVEPTLLEDDSKNLPATEFKKKYPLSSGKTPDRVQEAPPQKYAQTEKQQDAVLRSIDQKLTELIDLMKLEK